jgi:hypothetical protein
MQSISFYPPRLLLVLTTAVHVAKIVDLKAFALCGTTPVTASSRVFLGCNYVPPDLSSVAAESFSSRCSIPIDVSYFHKTHTFSLRRSCKSHPHAHICLTMVILGTRHSHSPVTPHRPSLALRVTYRVLTSRLERRKTARRDLAATISSLGNEKRRSAKEERHRSQPPCLTRHSPGLGQSGTPCRLRATDRTAWTSRGPSPPVSPYNSRHCKSDRQPSCRTSSSLAAFLSQGAATSMSPPLSRLRRPSASSLGRADNPSCP